jgi:uncharacterized protein (TIGR02266 family)
MEKRRCKRVRKELRVTWKTQKASIEGLTKDVCPGGVFIVTDQQIDPKTCLDLEVWFDMESPVDCHAEVVWVNHRRMLTFPPGFGVRFVELSQKALDSFLSLCATNDRRCAHCMFETD